jgi:hypothetical protein
MIRSAALFVYKYVKEGDNDPDTMQEAMNFFWTVHYSRT